MLQWLRRRSSSQGTSLRNRVIMTSADIVPSRNAAILTGLSSPKASRLGALFETDRYQSAGASVEYAQNCVIDTGNGLVILANGAMEPVSRAVASYWTDTTTEGMATTIASSASSSIKDDAIHLFHRSCGAYGHFILDGLCAVAVLADYIREHRLKILVPKVFPKWVADNLDVVGFGPASILRPDGVAACRSLTISSMLGGGNCFFPNPAAIAKLQQLVGTPAVEPSRRIYLTRDGGHSPRFVDNEDDVQALFAHAGFEIVRPASLSFRRQVELFASAKVIAGSHGSAFANMVFAPRGAHVIDLMPEDWVGYWGDSGTPERWLFNLTAACEHDYSLVLSPSTMEGEPYLPNSSKTAATIHTTVDLEAVRSVLSGLS